MLLLLSKQNKKLRLCTWHTKKKLTKKQKKTWSIKLKNLPWSSVDSFSGGGGGGFGEAARQRRRRREVEEEESGWNERLEEVERESE